jgi:fumarate hydratase class II
MYLRRLLSTRVERDTFGALNVPSAKYWGAQTQRSIQNFKIGDASERMPLPVIHALGVLKLAAIRGNWGKGGVEGKMGEAMVTAASEVR